MNRKIKYSIYGVVFWLLAFLIWEWSISFPKVRWTPVPFPETTEEKIDSILTQSLSEFLIPGIAFGLVQEGKISYLKSFGFENLETKDTFHLESKIPVASISKVFTALSTANYFLKKNIPISTELGQILPDTQNLPLFLNTITLKELLLHQSGLEDTSPIGLILKRDSQRGLENLLGQISKPKSSEKATRYADVNFDLLGLVLQEHSETSFDILSHQITLQKAGMASSFFTLEWPEKQNSMTGYGKTFLWKRIEPKRIQLERFPSPSSGLITTPRDLSMALIHLIRGEMGDFHPELNWLKGEDDFPAGFQRIQINGAEFKGHFGGQAGYSSLFGFSEENESGFFILTNAKDLSDHRKIITSSVFQALNKTP